MTKKPTWSNRVAALWAILGDRPVAYHPMLAKAVGGAKAGLFLTQLLYWDEKGTWRPGWTVKTQAEITEETALTRYETDTARKKLTKLGILECERRGVPARMHFRINYERLLDVVSQFVENQQTGLLETSKLDCGDPANQIGEIPQTISESTPETTPEIPAEKKRPAAPAALTRVEQEALDLAVMEIPGLDAAGVREKIKRWDLAELPGWVIECRKADPNLAAALFVKRMDAGERAPRPDKPPDAQDRRRFIEGEYADFIEH